MVTFNYSNVSISAKQHSSSPVLVSALRRRRLRPSARRGSSSRRPSAGQPGRPEALTEVTATPCSLEKDFHARVSFEDAPKAPLGQEHLQGEHPEGLTLEKVKPPEQRCGGGVGDRGE